MKLLYLLTLAHNGERVSEGLMGSRHPFLLVFDAMPTADEVAEHLRQFKGANPLVQAACTAAVAMALDTTTLETLEDRARKGSLDVSVSRNLPNAGLIFTLHVIRSPHDAVP